MIIDRLERSGFTREEIDDMTIPQALELIIVDNELKDLM